MGYFLTYKLEGYQEIFERKELCGQLVKLSNVPNARNNSWQGQGDLLLVRSCQGHLLLVQILPRTPPIGQILPGTGMFGSFYENYTVYVVVSSKISLYSSSELKCKMFSAGILFTTRKKMVLNEKFQRFTDCETVVFYID